MISRPLSRMSCISRVKNSIYTHQRRQPARGWQTSQILCIIRTNHRQGKLAAHANFEHILRWRVARRSSDPFNLDSTQKRVHEVYYIATSQADQQRTCVASLYAILSTRSRSTVVERWGSFYLQEDVVRGIPSALRQSFPRD
jgi:hypothetical protein